MNITPLLRTSDEYKEVKSMTNASVKYVHKIKVHPHMEQEFEKRQAQINAKRGFCEVKKLFHGSAFSNIQNIVDEGFDMNRCKTCVHGKGIYFSADPNFSLHYCSNKAQKHVLYLLLCDVLVGRCKTGVNNEILDTREYDNFHSGNIFVTTYTDGILPRYIVGLLFKN